MTLPLKKSSKSPQSHPTESADIISVTDNDFPGFNAFFSFARNDYAVAGPRREGFFRELGINAEKAVFLRQVHGDRILHVGSGGVTEKAEGFDGAITFQSNIPLCLLTADCLPIVVWDPVRKVIGVAHAGWRGTAGRIAVNLIKDMSAGYCCQPAHLKVFFGPGISGGCYDVQEEAAARFPAGTIQREGKLYLDLIKVNTDQLLESGLKTSNIFDSGFCTCCTREKLFSYRNGDQSARNLTVAVIRPGPAKCK